MLYARRIFLTTSFFISLLSPCFAQTTETIQIDTYYPAPYGSYAELTTTSNTYLATEGGNVGIGTTAPGSAKLAVIGGNVGIGTTAPQASLDVARGIKVGYDNDICDNNKEGIMRWNITIPGMQYCDGTSWGGGGLFWFGNAGIYLSDNASSFQSCGIPCGLTCAVPSLAVNAWARINGGVVQTRVTGNFQGVTGSDSCDSGWVSGALISLTHLWCYIPHRRRQLGIAYPRSHLPAGFVLRTAYGRCSS